MTKRASRNKLTLLDCQKSAEYRGGKCLSFRYINNKTKMLWQCKNGHQWKTSYSSIRNNHRWCRKCLKSNILDCQNAANKHGGRCISKIYTNNKTKMTWQCKKDHIWKTTFGSIRNGTWCQKCLKPTLQDCQKIALQRNGKCISKKYINNLHGMLWQCDLRHKWKASYSSVNSGKTWCPECRKTTIDLCISLATVKNGKCLSTVCNTQKTKILWQCSEGHIWMTTFDSVKRGTWCPQCSSGKSQNKLAVIMKKLFPKSDVEQNYRGFDWLKYKQKMEIDIWVPNKKLAIEYDGIQHFMPVRFGGITKEEANKMYLQTKIRDNHKDSLIKQHADDVRYFIRFSYMDKISEERIMQKLYEHGVLGYFIKNTNRIKLKVNNV